MMVVLYDEFGTVRTRKIVFGTHKIRSVFGSSLVTSPVGVKKEKHRNKKYSFLPGGRAQHANYKIKYRGVTCRTF